MRGGKVFAWLASVGHWLDVGGNVPGNFNAEGDRELPGGLPRPAGEARARRRAAAGHRRHPRRQLARAAVELGRPQRPAQRARSRRAPPARAARRIRRRHDHGRDCAAQRPRRGADARQHHGAAGRHLLLRRLPRQRRRHRQAASHRARPDDRGRPDDARFLALRAALRRPAQHRALDHGRLLLCRAQAPVHRRAGQRRLPRADRVRHSRHDAARRLGAEAGRRLHRDHPARHRRDLRRLRQGRAGARQRQPVRDHQRAVARRLARARPALGDVLLLRRRPRRQSRRATGSTTATTRSRPRPSRRSKSWSRSIR